MRKEAGHLSAFLCFLGGHNDVKKGIEMLDIVLIIIGLTAGIVSTIIGVLSFFSKKKEKLSIEFLSEDGRKLKIETDIIAVEDREKIEKLIVQFQEIDSLKSEDKAADASCKIIENESGFILSELFLYFVPGVIALLFSFTFIYLVVKNQKTPDYAIPKELSSAMTMIIGYFFGIGAASATNKGKVITLDEAEKYIQSLKNRENP